MAGSAGTYIGRAPVYGAFQSQNFNSATNGSQTAFTLQTSVSNSESIVVVVSGVVQEPGAGKAYVANGTTLTLSEAPGANETMYVIYLGEKLVTPFGDVTNLSDVTITSIASGEILKWNGSAWINNTLAEAGITAPTITALNNATANELVTVGSTTTELDAESNLTFNGSTLAVTGAVTVSTTLGVTGVTTLSEDVTFTGAANNVVWDKSDNALEFADSAKANFGAGTDLSIYHDGSHSYITDGGTGNLKITASQLDILGTGETMATFVDDGAVTLYHNNASKIATSASGVTVTGTVAMTGGPAAGIDTTQTFTKAQRGEIVTLSSQSTVTIDMATSNNFYIALGHNVTFANPSNRVKGQSGSIIISQDGTGGRTVSWGSNWDFIGGTAPTITTTANAIDRIDYIVRENNGFIQAVHTANYS